MAKKKKSGGDPARAYATSERFDGGQIRVSFVLQPDDAAKLADQIVTALLNDAPKPKE